MSNFKEITKGGNFFYEFDFNGLESRNQPKKLPLFLLLNFHKLFFFIAKVNFEK
jgi:hypothetical protein